VLYQMVALPVTLGDPNPKPPQILHFALPFIVVGEHRDFKYMLSLCVCACMCA